MKKKAVKKKKAATRAAKKATKKTASKTASRKKTAAKPKKKTTAKGKGAAAKRTTAKRSAAKKTTAKKTAAKKTTAKKAGAAPRKAPSRPKLEKKEAPVIPMREMAVPSPAPTAAAPAPTPSAPPAPAEQPIGVVTHYYSHLSVAVVQLNEGPLRVGDRIHIKGHTTDLRQEVESMEIDHQPVQEASAGQVFGLKVRDHVREHDQIYRG
jgi:hypothetical protein